MDHLALGKRGEELAVGLLERSGYRIVEKNARTPMGEIDLVAEEGSILCFVEVKARTSDEFGAPEEAVTPRKQHQIRKAAEAFLEGRKLWDRECRFDVVALVLDEAGHAIDERLIRHAFET